MQEIQLGRVYRHFKGDYYLVEAVAHDSETGALCVIYRKLYGCAKRQASIIYNCSHASGTKKDHLKKH